jgi:hypothetical protein
LQYCGTIPAVGVVVLITRPDKRVKRCYTTGRELEMYVKSLKKRDEMERRLELAE